MHTQISTEASKMTDSLFTSILCVDETVHLHSLIIAFIAVR